LQQLRAVEVTNTLECAGNGRAFFTPKIGGVRWGRGGVGNAAFSGPRLRDLLEKAGVKAGARHVAFKGMDVIPAGAQAFVRSIPIAKAIEPSTLVALKMNGAPLSVEHGFPARALVPGWIGSCSIKWLSEIRVLRDEFDGFYMQSAYRLFNSAGKREAITSLQVKSIITSPEDGANISARNHDPIRVQGAAWAGENAIAKIEISFGGGNWHPAQLAPGHSKFAWRLWSFKWRPARAGSYVLQARATDDYGKVQPERTTWNSSGYLWNGIDKVRVAVQA